MGSDFTTILSTLESIYYFKKNYGAPTVKAIVCVFFQLAFAILGAVSSAYSLSSLKSTPVGSVISKWYWGLGFWIGNLMCWLLAAYVKQDAHATPQPVELNRLPAPVPRRQPVAPEPVEGD
jgi:hypothetical protein